MCELHFVFRLLTISLLCSCNTNSSASCSHLPGYLRRHMQPEAEACHDFYEHACGSWAATHESRPYRSQFEQLDHVYHGRLATLLEGQEEPAVEASQPRFVQLLRDNYNACRKQQGHFKAAQFVSWLATWGNISWQQESPLKEMDYSRFQLLLQLNYKLRLQPEMFASGLEKQLEAVLWLLQLQLPWPAGDVDSAEFLPLTHAQFRRLYQALQPLGMPPQQLWQQVHTLERQLSELPQKEAADYEQLEEEGTEAETIEAWLLPLPFVNATQLPAINLPHYLQQQSKLLATQPQSLQLHYALLRLLHKLQLRPAPSFGRQQCAAQTRHLLTHAAVWLMQQQQTDSQRELLQATMQQLFEQLRQRFKLKLLNNRNRFRGFTQRFLLDKLQRMRLHLSVLPQTDAATQRQLLEAHYASLQLSDSDYYGNLLATLQQIEQWKQQSKTNDQQDVARLHLLRPDGYGSYASPFFLPDRNLVLLPHSLLATPLYRPHQVTVLTQSALGFLIAHEISHGFTPTDVHYDGRGRMTTKHHLLHTRFQRQIRCLLHNHNGSGKRNWIDIDEKFADLNGISLAFEAFHNSNPSANNSLQQAFFLNFAQVFCQDDSQLEDSLVHGGSRQRVNEAVASVESFARIFSCPRSKKPKCRFY